MIFPTCLVSTSRINIFFPCMCLYCVFEISQVSYYYIILMRLIIDVHCFVFIHFNAKLFYFFYHNISSTNVCQCGLDRHRTMKHPTSRHENANLLLDNIFTVRPRFLYKMKVIICFKYRTNNSVCSSLGCTPPPSAKKHPRHTRSHW